MIVRFPCSSTDMSISSFVSRPRMRSAASVLSFTMTMAESIAQARGAVSRAITILSQPYLMVGGVVSVVDPDRCAACLTCVRSCPYDVPHINAEGVAYIEPAACQGCGICASVCPRKAITLQHYSDEQIIAKMDALKEIEVKL